VKPLHVVGYAGFDMRLATPHSKNLVMLQMASGLDRTYAVKYDTFTTFLPK